MKITTQYSTTPSGAGKVIAKANGKQKTTRWDQAKSTDWNHGTAAGAFLLAKDSDDPLLLAGEDWQHDTNESGTVHTFYF